MVDNPKKMVSRQRQAALVSETREELVIDDFRWGRVDVGDPRLVPSFQRTTIRPARIVEVFWWSENFPPKWIAAHSQLVFVMQGTEGVTGEDGAEDIGFVFSVEARFRKGQSFNPFLGLLPHGEYGVIHMLTTLSDRLQRSALIYGHSMDSYRLLLSDDQKQELARLAIRTATTPRPDERYHTTRKNCVTETIGVINQVLPESERIDIWTIPRVLTNLRVVMSKWTPGTMIEKGLAERWASWDENVREVRLPQRAGGDYVLDVLSLPGSQVPREARVLENSLHEYISAAQSYRAIEALRSRLPPGDASISELDKERLATEEHLLETGEAVTELTAAAPEVTVPYLLGLERPDTPQARTLILCLLSRLHEEMAAGRWVPSPEMREKLAALAAEQDP